MLTLDLGDEDYKSSKFVRVCARVCVEISVVTFHGIGVTIMSFVVVYKKTNSATIAITMALTFLCQFTSLTDKLLLKILKFVQSLIPARKRFNRNE